MNKSNRFCIVFFIVAVGYFSNSCKKEDTPPPRLPEITTLDVTLSVFRDGAYGSSGGTIKSTGGSRITASGICWSTQELPTILDSKYFTGTPTGYENNPPVFRSVGTYTCPLLGLKRLTTYYVRAFATNSIGTAYGNQVSFTTPDISWMQLFSIILPYPTDKSFAVSTNPELTWHHRQPGFSTITRLNYDVYLDTDPNPTTKIATNLTTESLQLTGLIPGTKYYWKIFGWDVSYPENNATSSIYSFTTAPALVIPSVSTAPVTIYSSTSATVGGNVTSDRGAMVTERGVYWSTSQKPEMTGTKLPIGSGSGSFSIDLSGLNLGTTYFMRAYATNSAGTALGAQISFNLNSGSSKVTDIDGNNYNIVTIDSQVWMAENLKTTRYADGATIPLVSTTDSWIVLTNTSKAYCWYDDNITNKDTYGALYTWAAAMNGASSSNSNPSGVQGACPTGWHVPSDEEWITLTTYLGGESVAGGKMKEVGNSNWIYPNTGATNESGFSGRGGGYRIPSGIFRDLGVKSFFWSSSQGLLPISVPRGRSLDYKNEEVFNAGFYINTGGYLRCVKDN